MKIKAEYMGELEEFGFETMSRNTNYFIRYIPDNMITPLMKITKDTEYYRTLYIDKETRIIEVYNDYLDCKIELKNEYIQDLIKHDMVEE